MDSHNTDLQARYQLKEMISTVIYEENGVKTETLPDFIPNEPDHKITDDVKGISHIITFQNGNSLYLGNQSGAGVRKESSEEDLAKDFERLRALGIKAIVTCRDIKPKFHGAIEYLIIPMDKDVAMNVDISKKMRSAFEFISEHLETGSVFVHCKNGRTRSATTVTYFLMRFFKLDFYTVKEFVLTRRDSVKFKKYEQRLINFYKLDIENA